jgi:hypothetical protein
VSELEAERDEAKDLDAMDDAVHVASPWEPRKSLCGQWNRRNLAPLDGPSLDEGSGCWSCMDVAKWIHDRSRVQAGQIAALQEEANEFVATIRASVDACSLRLRAALALAEGCAAPARTSGPLCMDSRCAHPKGFHRKGHGSCLECACIAFKPAAPADEEEK